tara:strand:+ start:459 stop:1118 length:660 start_codon:yes stop_codon:yes gene_type:complete
MAKIGPDRKNGVLRKMSKVKICGNREVPIVLRAIFSNYDKDNSGYITRSELNVLVLELQSLLPGTPAHLKHCSDKVAEIAIRALDIDNNGTVDEDEFVEWCQQNLFLSTSERSALLVQNLDLSQFITALEICVRMQLVGIGPYSYYTPPAPTFKEKYCVTYKHCFCWCSLCLAIFLAIFVPVCIYIIYPWAQEEGYVSINAKRVPRVESVNTTQDSLSV